MRQAKAACQLKRQMPRGARLTVKGAGAEREGWCRLMLYVEDAAMWPTVVHHAQLYFTSGFSRTSSASTSGEAPALDAHAKCSGRQPANACEARVRRARWGLHA